MDGDGNGFFADAQDRLWLDLDGRGRWDPVEHQFLFAPLLQLNGQRYVVQSDLRGEKLAFVPVDGAGTIRLAVPKLLGGDVADVTVTLLSRDGTVATLQGQGAEAVLPTGDYRVTTLLLNLKPRGDGKPWGYVISDNSLVQFEWHTLTKNETLTLDPVGKLSFVAATGDRCVAGKMLAIQPQLRTGDNLLITTVYLGSDYPLSPFSNGPGARIRVADQGGKVLGVLSSGFA